MKRKLTIEELDVETFVVAEAAAARGTVRAHADPQPGSGLYVECPGPETIREWTCIVDLCQPSFVDSCGGDPEQCGVAVDP